jgi:lambda repressor-like predicted transcriptional regulator
MAMTTGSRPRARWSPDPAWLAARYQRDGCSAQQIAGEAGVSRRLVLIALERHGIARRRRGRRSGSAVADAGWLRREYVDRGRTTADIAAELGLADDTIRDALLRHGITPRRRGGVAGRRKPGRPPQLEDPQWLAARYWEQRLSIRAVARELRVSASAVRAAMLRHDIPRRPPATVD